MITSALRQAQYECENESSVTFQEVLGQLRERSSAVDQSGQFSKTNWDLLRQVGLLGLVVPEEYGGPALRPTQWLEVVRKMGRACPSTTLCHLMHLCATSVIVATGNANVKRRILPQVAEGQLTVAYAGTERATGTNFWALESSAEKIEGGWRLRLTKDWATLAEVADIFVVPTRAHPTAAIDEISLFLVERSVGVESRAAWCGTGMRGSSSGPVHVNAVVSDDHLMGNPGRANDYITTDMFNLLLLSHAALYLGIAEEAFALATERAKARWFPQTNSSLADTSLWQSRLGAQSAKLAAGRALIQETARRLETDEGREHLLKDALAGKLLGCEAARHTTDLAMQVFGGSGYNMGQRVEMLWRDARAGSLMRPSDEVTEILLGKLETDRTLFQE